MTCVVPRERLNVLLQEDFAAFLWRVFHTLNPRTKFEWHWYLDAMCHSLNVARRTPADRLVITIPPRHLKSIAVSIAFVAWMIGKDPSLKFLVASYGAELCVEMSRMFRKVVESAWYRSAFPDMKLERRTDGEIRTTLGGVRKAVSVGGATTGFGADWIIADDLTKAQEANLPGAREASTDYYRGALITRLNDPVTGRIIVIGQRLHEEDVPGYCLETGRYRHLNLPAIAPGPAIIPLGRGRVQRVRTGALLRLPMHTLEALRLDMGTAGFNAQYLQDPVPTESVFIRWHRIERYAEAPLREEFQKMVVSVDTAQVDTPDADYTVATVWGFLRGKWWLVDLKRFRGEFALIMDRVLALRLAWAADVLLIEDASSGKALLSALRFQRNTARHADHSWQLMGYRPKDSKEVRWAAQAAKLESGFAVFPEDAPWLEELRREIVAFPMGKHDDQVDSIAQFLDWTRGRTGRTLMLQHNGRNPREDGPRPNPPRAPDLPRRDFGPRP